MLHSVRQIGENHEKFSALRKEKNPFICADFIKFAEDNMRQYSVSREDGGLLMVSTWHSDDLVNDYKKTIK